MSTQAVSYDAAEDSPMVTVLAHGENAFRLVNAADHDVGWVRSKATDVLSSGLTGPLDLRAVDGVPDDAA